MIALLDNATLTAAFRAAGLIPNPSRELFELDVAALRVLVDAIILADKVCVLDTYKSEHTIERKDWLKYDCIEFRQIPERLDHSMGRNAVAHVSNWGMGRHVAAELQPVFDDISILFRHAWRHSDSFLVLKGLGLENKHGSTMVKALREHLANAEDIHTLKKLSGKAYNTETRRIVQSMSWAAIRTVYYRQVAKFLGCEYCPHPLRSVYNAKCILFDNHPDTRRMKLHSVALRGPALPRREQLISAMERRVFEGGYMGQVSKFFRTFWQECNEKDDNVFGVSTFDADIPPFLSYVLAESDPSIRKGNILESAYKLRRSSEVAALRSKLTAAYAAEDHSEQNRLVRELSADLRELKHRLQVYLGYKRERVELHAKLIAYEFTVPRFLTKPLYPHKPHLAFVRDVVLELASVGAMGALLDKLWLSANRRGAR